MMKVFLLSKKNGKKKNSKLPMKKNVDIDQNYINDKIAVWNEKEIYNWKRNFRFFVKF